jgi:peptide/nickel transport system permease protein
MPTSVRTVNRAWRFGRRSPLGVVALLFLSASLIIAAFAEGLAPRDPLEHDLENRLQPPSRDFLMGTDNFGRDVLSRVIYGARTSLFVGLVSIAVVTVVGTALGTASAFVGGGADLLGQRLADALMAFPALVLALVLVAAFGPSTLVVVIAIVAALTPQMARLARARCLELKEEDYILAARAVGATSWRIMGRHILPGSLAPVLVLATGYVGNAMVLEAALSYLGLGVPPPEPSWGRMIFEGTYLYLETAPWLTIFPGLTLSVLVLSFALLGDALRDALDPHYRHRGISKD